MKKQEIIAHNQEKMRKQSVETVVLAIHTLELADKIFG